MNTINRALVAVGAAGFMLSGTQVAHSFEMGMLLSTQLPVMSVQGSSSLAYPDQDFDASPTPSAHVVPSPETPAGEIYTAEFNRLIADGHVHTAHAQNYAEYLLELAMDPDRASVWYSLDRSGVPEWSTGERNGGSWIGRYSISVESADELNSRIEAVTADYPHSNMPGFGIAMATRGDQIYLIETFSYNR